MKLLRAWRWAIAALLLLLAWALYAAGSGEGSRWTSAEARELVLGIPFGGVLFALENVDLGPPSDTVRDIWQYNLSFIATDGKEVRALEPVLRFDTSELMRKIAEAQAELDETNKTLEKRGIEIEIQRRDRRLSLAEAEARARKSELELSVPEELLARRELETTRIDRHLAQVEIEFRRRSLAGIDRAEEIEMASLRERAALAAAKLADLEKSVQAMTVVAPRSGTVVVRSRRGSDEKFKSGDIVWGAEKVLQIPDLGTLRAEVEIDEALGGRLATGQRASFYLDAHPDHELRGVVEQIKQTVQRKSNFDANKILKVTLTLERDEKTTLALRPGMRLRGQIEQERRAGVLAIPEEAVYSDQEGVYVETEGWWGVRRTRPRLGTRSRGYFEVLAGLEKGQRVRLPATADGGQS